MDFDERWAAALAQAAANLQTREQNRAELIEKEVERGLANFSREDHSAQRLERLRAEVAAKRRERGLDTAPTPSLDVHAEIEQRIAAERDLNREVQAELLAETEFRLDEMREAVADAVAGYGWQPQPSPRRRDLH